MSPSVVTDTPPAASIASDSDLDISSIGNPFSIKRPKDCLAGFSSGIKNFLKGIGMGFAVFIGGPIVGAKQEGLSGFGRGVLIGSISAVFLSVAGALTGVVQVGRGLANTPEAMRETAQGEKSWDSTRRVWLKFNLQKEADQILTETEDQYFARLKVESKGKPEETTSSESEQTQPKNKKHVKDMEFYDLLEVDSDATPGQIKKAYYLQARKHHPDKNIGNTESNAKFQQISSCYQILQDPVLREKYDKFGKDAVQDTPVLDASTLYMLVFGSEKFEFYVGELKLAMMMLDDPEKLEKDFLQGSSGFSPFSNKIILFKQAKREITCALNLVKLIQTGVDEIRQNKPDFPEFTSKLKEEAENLVSTEIGKNLIYIIGYVIREEAKNFLGFDHSVPSGFGLLSMKRKAHVMSTQYRFVTSIINGYREAKKQGILDDMKKQGQSDGPPNEATMVESIVVMVESLWRLSVIDIEYTIRQAAKKVLWDCGVSKSERINRAQALKHLGGVFKAYGSYGEKGLHEIKQKIRDTVQTMRTAQQHQSAYGQGTTQEPGPSSVPTDPDWMFEQGYQDQEIHIG